MTLDSLESGKMLLFVVDFYWYEERSDEMLPFADYYLYDEDYEDEPSDPAIYSDCDKWLMAFLN